MFIVFFKNYVQNTEGVLNIGGRRYQIWREYVLNGKNENRTTTLHLSARGGGGVSMFTGALLHFITLKNKYNK